VIDTASKHLHAVALEITLVCLIFFSLFILDLFDDGLSSASCLFDFCYVNCGHLDLKGRTKPPTWRETAQ
jgi:hypothetical protein